MGRPSKYETHVLPRLDEIADWCRNGATNVTDSGRSGGKTMTVAGAAVFCFERYCIYQKFGGGVEKPNERC